MKECHDIGMFILKATVRQPSPDLVGDINIFTHILKAVFPNPSPQCTLPCIL